MQVFKILMQIHFYFWLFGENGFLFVKKSSSSKYIEYTFKTTIIRSLQMKHRKEV